MAGSTFLLLHLNGKPVAGLALQFHSAEKCDFSTESIADNGLRYCIACSYSAYATVTKILLAISHPRELIPPSHTAQLLFDLYATM